MKGITMVYYTIGTNSGGSSYDWTTSDGAYTYNPRTTTWMEYMYQHPEWDTDWSEIERALGHLRVKREVDDEPAPEVDETVSSTCD